MIKDFSFSFTTKIEFGAGCIEKCGEIVKNANAKNVMIVTDEGLTKIPAFESVKNSIEAEVIKLSVFDKVRANPRDIDAQEAGDFARAQEIDGVIAFGGGSSMDIAKAIAAMLTNKGTIKDMMSPNKPQNKSAFLVCIPTTAGTGSEVTSFAVLTLIEEKRKSSIFADTIRPDVAICDPKLLRDIPGSIAAATGMDALTHAIEAYTCKLATPISDGIALQAIRYIGASLESYVNSRNDEDCYKMMMGSMLAGIAFGYSDIAAVHCMGEALGAYYDIPHGVANSIFLPLVFDFNSSSDEKKHADVACALGLDMAGMSMAEKIESAKNWLNDISSSINIPSLSEFNQVSTEDFDILSKMCMKNVSMPSNPRNVEQEDFEKLFYKAYGKN